MEVLIYPRGAERKKDFQPVSGTRVVTASSLGSLESVRYSTRIESGFGGHDLASWVIQPLGSYAGGICRPGDPVTIQLGGGAAWEGQIADVNPRGDGTVEFNARGFGYDLFDYLATYYQSATGPDLMYPTTDFDDAYAQAVADRGLPVDRYVGVLPGTLGTSQVAENFIYLGELLSTLLNGDGRQWAVWGRTLVIEDPETTVTYRYTADTGLVGVADSEYVTDLVGWYQAVDPATTQTDYQFERVTDTAGLAMFDRREAGIDMRGLGLQTPTQVQDYLSSVLEKVKGRWLLTGSVVIESDGRAIPSGGIALPAFVRAGKVMRVPEVRTSQGNLMPDGNQFTIGRTEYEWSADGSQRLTITPKGAVARSISSLLEAPKPDGNVVGIVGSGVPL